MSWWNPVTWVTYAEGEAVQVAKPIVAFVEKAVKAAIDLVEKDLDTAADFAARIIEDVKYDLTSAIDGIASYAVSVYHTVEGDITNAIDYSVKFADQAYHDAEKDISTGISTVEHYAQGLYNEAIKYAEEAVSAAVSTAERLANEALTDAEKYASDALTLFQRDIFDPLEKDAEQALSWASTVFKWFSNGVAEDWALLKKAWGWVEWFAVHTFDDLEDVGADVVNGLDRFPNEIASLLEGSAGKDALSSIANYLGQY